MKRFDLRILWGGLLIVAGGLFLLQEFSLIPSAWDLIWSVLFGVAGCVFLYAYWTDRSQWWPLIPGLGLIGLAAVILVEEMFPSADWAGAIFLGLIGLSFWVIFLLNRNQWWAVIPGGVLATLAVVAGVDGYVQDDVGGGIFMLGLGLTFAFLGILPTQEGRMRWAFIPAAVLLLIGIFMVTPLMPLLNYVWPAVLILIGGYLILRNFRS